MDLSAITDLKELKALAYDRLAQKEALERDLQMINQRIAQVVKEAEKEVKKVEDDKKLSQ